MGKGRGEAKTRGRKRGGSLNLSTAKRLKGQQSHVKECLESIPSTSTRSSLEGSNADAILDYGDLIGICSDSKNDIENTETIPSEEVVTVECLNEAGTSNYIEHASVLDLSSGSTEYNIDDRVIVQYEKEFYPGVIIDYKDNMFLVRCMEKTGAHWKWPDNNDDLWYKQSDILKHLFPEDIIPVSNRGVFSINVSLFGAKLLCNYNL